MLEHLRISSADKLYAANTAKSTNIWFNERNDEWTKTKLWVYLIQSTWINFSVQSCFNIKNSFFLGFRH